jgi:hypothetical protein
MPAMAASYRLVRTMAVTGADRVHDRAGVPNAPFIPPSVSATADATGTGLPSTLLS